MKILLVLYTLVCAAIAASPPRTPPPQGHEVGIAFGSKADSSSGRECQLSPGIVQIKDHKNGTYGVSGDLLMFDTLVYDSQDLYVNARHAVPYGQKELKPGKTIRSDPPSPRHPAYIRHNQKDIKHSPCASQKVVNYIPGTQISYIEHRCHPTQRNEIPPNMVCGQMYQYRYFRYRGGDETSKKRVIKSVFVNQMSGCDLRYAGPSHNRHCGFNPEGEDIC